MGAQGPTVKLTFAGDATSLDKTMSHVGKSTEDLSSSIGKSTKEIGESGEGMKGKMSEAADGTEQKMLGLHDVVDGLSGTFQGFKDGSISEVSQGFADMAGGIASFVIPAMGTLGGAFGKAAGAVKGFSLTLLTSPITWIILGIVALIAVIVLMVTHWSTVKRVVGDVTRALVSAWRWVEGIVGGVFSRIGHAASSVWDGLGNGLKAALNGVVWVLNKGIDGINFLIRGIDWLPGVNLGQIPHIPKLHTGGMVPGVAGSEMLAVLQAGERVIPATGPQQGSGGGTVTFRGDTDGAFATAFMSLVRQGKIQVST